MKPMKTTDGLDPILFVIFGGAGDLTWRKLVPALFDLSQDRSLPAQFAVIAVDRVKLGDDALRRRLHDGVNQFSRFGKAGLSRDREFARIVIEKPIGYDLESARALNAVLAASFEESQIFRIDHY